MRCMKFLFDTTNGAGDICALIKQTEDNFPEANLEILRELISVGNASLQLSGKFPLLLVFFRFGEPGFL